MLILTASAWKKSALKLWENKGEGCMPEKGLVRDLKKKPGQALFYDIGNYSGISYIIKTLLYSVRKWSGRNGAEWQNYFVLYKVEIMVACTKCPKTWNGNWKGCTNKGQKNEKSAKKPDLIVQINGDIISLIQTGLKIDNRTWDRIYARKCEKCGKFGNVFNSHFIKLNKIKWKN